MKETNSNSQKKNYSDIFQLVILLIIAFTIRWQIIEPRWIPSGSMLPTLQLKDKILIEKVIPRFDRLQRKNLKVGTIIVFSPPEALIEAGYSEKQDLIKRIEGLPGDEIEVEKGNLIRNGQIVEEEWRTYQMLYEMKKFVVPPNSVWVLGDNRNNSLDSHIWGPLPEENIIGTAIWRYWPLDNFGPIRFPTPSK
tara:strand:- start:1353 stop:1934 length:582 start_codon:yes stop_codon:yes gene_type:complete